MTLYFTDQDLNSGGMGAESALADPTEDLEDFVFRPAPQGHTIKCRITRDKKGVDRGKFQVLKVQSKKYILDFWQSKLFHYLNVPVHMTLDVGS